LYPLTEIWRGNFRRGLIHGPGSRPVNKGLLRFLVDSPAKSGRVKIVESLLRAPPSNLYHSIMRSPSFGLPSPNRITPPELGVPRCLPVSKAQVRLFLTVHVKMRLAGLIFILPPLPSRENEIQDFTTCQHTVGPKSHVIGFQKISLY